MATRAFPQDPDSFPDDPRVSFSKQTQTYILEDDDGNEWEWLPGPQKWSKTMDEESVKRQAEIYKVAGVDEDEPALNPVRKRKEAMLEEPETNPKDPKAHAGAGTAGAKTTAAPPPPPPKKNSAVYVTGLPEDIDADELREFFSRYGIIAESLDDNGKRIKLYNDKDGKFKGEALIIYHRPESVVLAIEMADGAWLPREDGLKSTQIHVAEADSSFKAHKGNTVAEDRPNPKAKAKSNSRALAKKKAEEMNSRLADWDDDEPSKMQQTSSRSDKVVVIKGLFTLEGLKNDPDLLLDIQDDLREDAEPFGAVKNVTVFDMEDSGVATIRFADAIAAKSCANYLDGKGYNGSTITASISTGEEKFKKTRKNFDGEEAERKRLEEYSKFIEGQ